MTDKEFRRLGKSELIEIIYELKKREEESKKELEDVRTALQEHNIKIETAGSIAEAAIGLHGVFESAQKAADMYLEQIHVANADTEKKCHEMIEEAENYCRELKAKTEKECREKIEETDREIEKKWELLQEKTDALIKAHSELKALLESTSSNQ